MASRLKRSQAEHVLGCLVDNPAGCLKVADVRPREQETLFYFRSIVYARSLLRRSDR